MAKIKTPLYSLGGTGSVGDVLSLVRRRGVNIAEKKPVPAYRQSLLQMYQRWLYEDYMLLWKEQTPAVQAQYRSLGAKCHLTGYQYWMSYQLTNLPDILGWWKLDTGAVSMAPDSSRNHNDADIFGASPAAAVIDGGLYFDGLNDYLNCGSNPVLNPLGAFSLECFLNIPVSAGYKVIFCAGENLNKCYCIYARVHPDSRLSFWVNVAGENRVILGGSILWGVKNHIVATWDGVATQYLIINGVPFTQAPTLISVAREFTNLYIGDTPTSHRWLKGTLDECRLYNRVLSVNEAIRHMNRQFPL